MNRQRRVVVKGLAATPVVMLTACGEGSGGERHQGKAGEGVVAGDGAEYPAIRFDHGVASGDPLDDRVILWTRVTPTDTLPRQLDAVTVRVDVARNRDLSGRVASYNVTTGPERDFCVKVDATGLEPDTWYYFQFSVGNQRSPVGRTRTFPSAGSFTDRARFAVVSCSNFAYGLFSVYRAVSQQADLDFILHLGDYIYEYGPGEYGGFPGREPLPPHEITVLDDYRQRHAQYKTDANLQSVHQQFPMICIWDDHESANDSYRDGAENHSEATEGAWARRRTEAVQAYFEWLPVRETPSDAQRLWRRFAFGDLIDLFMLDTRLEGRDQQVASPADPERFSAGRRLISAAQMDWLLSGLAGSTARWRMIGQQVMFAELNVARTVNTADLLGLDDLAEFNGQLLAINMDQWDGYVADREVILQDLIDKRIGNTVVFTGDIHTSWANEIYRDPSLLVGGVLEEPVAAEFVTPSVTSPGFPDGLAEIAAAAVPVANPHIKYTELKSPGFILVDVTRQRTQAEFHYVRNITSEDHLGQLDSGKTKVVGVDSGSSRIYQDRPLSRPRSVRTALFHPPLLTEVG